MKYNYFYFLLLIYISFQSYGQPNAARRKERIERVNAAKIGYITDRLKLSESEAEKFWPVYNEYSEKRQDIYDEIRSKIRTGREAQLSADDKNRLIDETMELKEEELKLQKTYKPRFLKIISVSQYLELLNAERDFNKILLDKLRERGGN